MTSQQKAKDAPRRRRGRQTAQGELERDREVERVAWALFAAKGYAGATIDEISRQAAVAKRTLYDVYGGKPGLLDRVVNTLANPIRDLDSFADCLTAKEILARAVRTSLLDDAEDRSVVVMRLLIAESVGSRERMQNIQMEARTHLRDNYATLFKYIFDRKLLDPQGDPVAGAEFFVDVVIGSVLMARLSGAPVFAPTLINEAVGLFLAGYAAWQSERSAG